MRIPIFLYKPKFISLAGRIIIESHVKTGMIRLGFPTVGLYPNNGIIIENRGIIKFANNCIIGNSSSIVIGKNGVLEFGENFVATAALKMVCYNSIKIGDNSLFGWESIVTDTDFHSFNRNGLKTKGIGSIVIGDNNWLAMQCLVLKNTKTPNYLISTARSVLNKDYSQYERIMISGQPADIIEQNVWHDHKDDAIQF